MVLPFRSCFHLKTSLAHLTHTFCVRAMKRQKLAQLNKNISRNSTSLRRPTLDNTKRALTPHLRRQFRCLWQKSLILLCEHEAYWRALNQGWSLGICTTVVRPCIDNASIWKFGNFDMSYLLRAWTEPSKCCITNGTVIELQASASYHDVIWVTCTSAQCANYESFHFVPYLLQWLPWSAFPLCCLWLIDILAE